MEQVTLSPDSEVAIDTNAFRNLYSHNLSLLPLQAWQKVPHGEWSEYQTTICDPFTLEEWIAHEFNIGVATGTVSGVFVLDCDAVSVFEWVKANRELPSTPTVRTPRGYHLYFALPDFPVKNGAGLHRKDADLPEGLDVRGEGGFIVGPGSFYVPMPEDMDKGKIPGSYGWVKGLSLDDLQPAPPPEWLLDLIKPKPLPIYDADSYVSVDISDNYLRSVVEGECDEVRSAPSGTSNQTLHDAAARLGNFVGGGSLDRRDAEQELMHAALLRKIPSSEAKATIRSGLDNGVRTPVTSIMREKISLASPARATAPIPTPTDVSSKIAAETPKAAHVAITFKGFSAADAFDIDCPPQEWVIEGLIPTGHVTTIFGDGGVGKSLLAQTMGSYIAAGEPFAGRDTRAMRVAALMCEDDEGELNRRQRKIVERSFDPEEVRNFSLHSRVGEDTTLGHMNAGKIWEVSPTFIALEAWVVEEGIQVLILDNIMQIFAGEMNDNLCVTAFLRSLTALARKMKGAVILLGHIAKAENSKFAGAMAWNNAVRSRLFLSRGPDDQPDNIRSLTVEKSNYGSTGDRIDFALHEGVLIDPATITEEEVRAAQVKVNAARVVITAILRRDGSISQSHQSPAYIRGKDYLSEFRRAKVFDEGTIKQALSDMIADRSLTKLEDYWGNSKSKKPRLVLSADPSIAAKAKIDEVLNNAR